MFTSSTNINDTEESIVFITKDTFISNDSEEQRGDQSTAEFIRVGRGSKNVISQTLLGLYNKDSLPQDHVVVDVKLCLYQYFAGSNAASIDPFRVNIIIEDWNNNVVASTKPTIGPRIATFYFDSTEGKDCITFDSIEQIEELEHSFGVIISGGTAAGRKERYFTSSNWLSVTRNVEEKASSLLYHPHWKIKSVLPNHPVIGINPNEVDPNAQSPKSHVVIIVSCLVSLFVSMAGIYFWRRQRDGFSNGTYRSDSSKFNLSVESGSIHDAQLQEIYQMTEKNKAIQKSMRNLRKGETLTAMNKGINHNEKMDQFYSSEDEREKKDQNCNQNENENKRRGQSKSRRSKTPVESQRSTNNNNSNENFSSLSSYNTERTNDDSITTSKMMEKQTEPCSMEKLCLKVIHRKGKYSICVRHSFQICNRFSIKKFNIFSTLLL